MLHCCGAFDLSHAPVSWDLQTKEHFLSGSWDSTVCLWDASRDVPLNTFAEHTYCVYEANWSPTLPRTVKRLQLHILLAHIRIFVID